MSGTAARESGLVNGAEVKIRHRVGTGVRVVLEVRSRDRPGSEPRSESMDKPNQ